MTRHLLSIILSVVLLCGCNSINEIDDQRTEIISYLDDLGVEYNDLGYTFRYFEVEDNTEDTDNQAEYISKGSKFEIYFAAYTFDSSPSSLYFTNIESLATESLDGLNTEYWSFDPLEITLGQTDLLTGLEKGLEGCQYGDTVHIIMCSDQAYGAKGSGVVGANTAIMYSIQILDQQ